MNVVDVITFYAVGPLLSSVSGWIILVAATVTALGVIWRKVINPLRLFIKNFKEWMHRVETSTTWVDEQMRTNHGSSLVDKVDTLIRDVDILNQHVTMLLEHDAERDVKGRRYGPEFTSE